jgi:hypothetical protein
LEPSGEPFTPDELQELYIGIPPGHWAIVKRSHGRPYVVAVATDETDAYTFARTVSGHVVRSPPERAEPSGSASARGN